MEASLATSSCSPNSPSYESAQHSTENAKSTSYGRDVLLRTNIKLSDSIAIKSPRSSSAPIRHKRNSDKTSSSSSLSSASTATYSSLSTLPLQLSTSLLSHKAPQTTTTTDNSSHSRKYSKRKSSSNVQNNNNNVNTTTTTNNSRKRRKLLNESDEKENFLLPLPLCSTSIPNSATITTAPSPSSSSSSSTPNSHNKQDVHNSNSTTTTTSNTNSTSTTISTISNNNNNNSHKPSPLHSRHRQSSHTQRDVYKVNESDKERRTQQLRILQNAFQVAVQQVIQGFEEKDDEEVPLEFKGDKILRYIPVGNKDFKEESSGSHKELIRWMRREFRELKTSLESQSTFRVDHLQKKLQRREEQHQLDKVKLLSLEQAHHFLQLKYCTLDRQYATVRKDPAECSSSSFPITPSPAALLPVPLIPPQTSQSQPQTQPPPQPPQCISELPDNSLLETIRAENAQMKQRIDYLEQLATQLNSEKMQMQEAQEFLQQQLAERTTAAQNSANADFIVRSLETQLTQANRELRFEREKVSCLEAANQQLWESVQELERQLQHTCTQPPPSLSTSTDSTASPSAPSSPSSPLLVPPAENNAAAEQEQEQEEEISATQLSQQFKNVNDELEHCKIKALQHHLVKTFVALEKACQSANAN